MLLVVAVPQGIFSWLGQRRVNVEHVRTTSPRFVTNLNRAPWPELTLLPSIGPALAQRIVTSREQEGRFQRPEDLLRVRGIGPKTLTAIRPYLEFEE
jgi:competence protein ComEA